MGKRPLIFVVDDDPLVLKLVSAELKSSNYDVMSFSYGEECLAEIHLNPDIVVLDYIFVKSGTVVLGGKEILLEIRKIFPEMPVIMLSGQDSGSAVLELIKIGIEEYVIKDKNFTGKLKETISGILENNKP